MAINEYPETGTRVRIDWVHPEDATVYENVIGKVVPLRDAYREGRKEQDTAEGWDTESDEFYEDEFDLLDALGVFHSTVGIKVESVEASTVDEIVSQNYAHGTFDNVTVLSEV